MMNMIMLFWRYISCIFTDKVELCFNHSIHTHERKLPQDLKIADLRFGRKCVIVSKEASLFELIDKSVLEAHLNIEKKWAFACQQFTFFVLSVI